MDPVLERILESPKMTQLYEKLGQILAEEQSRRQHFYDTLPEGQKTEFINGEVIVHSRVKLRYNLASKHLLMLLDMYARKRGLGLVGHEKLLISIVRSHAVDGFAPSVRAVFDEGENLAALAQLMVG